MRRVSVVLVVLATGACGGGGRGAASVPIPGGGSPSEVRADLLPAEFAGFNVTSEDVTQLEKEAGPTSYLASTRLWALRSGERLRATLQVSTFVPDSEPTKRKFQETIVGQISESRWRPRILGGNRVYVTSANQQPMFIWFTGTAVFVMSVSKDHATPRGLLRQALEIRP